jgi:saccharopine dehydrogenase (NAD+, L-lysine-forming)
MPKTMYIRKEANESEHRTPIIPNDIVILIKNNFIIYVEKSNNRIYKDQDYQLNGAILTEKPWWDNEFKNTLIIGLKDINLNKLHNHKHLYFSHSYKNQFGSQEILSQFKNSKSIIYDFEYFLDDSNKRIISFGLFAGINGCILGLLQFINKRLYNININNLNCWNSKDIILKNIKKNLFLFDKIKIAIIGANGNCGNGVIQILNCLNIEYTIFYKNTDKSTLKNFDIIYNCITLNENYNEIWFDNSDTFLKPLIIVDISCDYSKNNNPIKLYNKATTWENPVYSYNNFVDIIAINNLPSLLPNDSSDYFSEKCISLLLNIETDDNKYWEKNHNIFYRNISSL